MLGMISEKQTTKTVEGGARSFVSSSPRSKHVEVPVTSDATKIDTRSRLGSDVR